MNAYIVDPREWPTDAEEGLPLSVAIASPTWRTDEPQLVEDVRLYNPDGFKRVEARADAWWAGRPRPRRLRLTKGQTRQTYLQPFNPEPKVSVH